MRPLILGVFFLAIVLIVTAIRTSRSGSVGTSAQTDRGYRANRPLQHRLYIPIAIAGGAVAAYITTTGGTLGRGYALAAPIFALTFLGGVIASEISKPPERTAVRRASLTTRTTRQYVPVPLTAAVVVGTVVLGALMVLGATAGVADDLGRSGRSFAFQCGEFVSGANGPWPGGFYVGPLALILATVLVLTAIGLWALTWRTPVDNDLASDSGERLRSASRVIAAAGLAISIPLAGISAIMASALSNVPSEYDGTACTPGWPAVVAPILLIAALGGVALAFWCLSVLLVPVARRSGKVTT
ncbi:hypothetical protein IEU95_04865 [Hoyosella rhizosphaerae]|uniref:Uncharacterized protein n=1 Tax=Hoyosella rhizosphaerae TaxID=1755582 RepID=A0A916XD99_9ACTN|nr:hypothetical protein [Hoyosella rhizosphaerae]MBN4926149.1 hypothetical protein [Hoyosella rhizosphaerae]GGC65145.1 hypothetical protein GCM10011410_17050 [Hoyosella rhizosphaerae]